MSAPEIKHIAVRVEMLVDQFNERIFTVASPNFRVPTMSISSRRDSGISQPAIHIARSRILCH
jgi:hypothetical protein